MIADKLDRAKKIIITMLKNAGADISICSRTVMDQQPRRYLKMIGF